MLIQNYICKVKLDFIKEVIRDYFTTCRQAPPLAQDFKTFFWQSNLRLTILVDITLFNPITK